MIHILCAITRKVFYARTQDVEHTPGSIDLPKPSIDPGLTLIHALNKRSSHREYRDEPISLQDTSNLLWAGFGINRQEGEGRTTPSSKNLKELELFVFLKTGVYIYRVKENFLQKFIDADCRAVTGIQDFVATAPMNLVFVSDQFNMLKKTQTERNFASGAHAGSVYQNINLYCCASNIGCVVRAAINRKAIAKRLKLDPWRKVIMTQSIGYKL